MSNSSTPLFLRIRGSDTKRGMEIKPVEIKKHTLDILKEFEENGCDLREDD